MKTLNRIQRSTWLSILDDTSHPWFELAEQALKKDASIKRAKRIVKNIKP